MTEAVLDLNDAIDALAREKGEEKFHSHMGGSWDTRVYLGDYATALSIIYETNKEQITAQLEFEVNYIFEELLTKMRDDQIARTANQNGE